MAVTLVKAMTDAFRLPNESVAQWAKEMGSLTNEDRKSFAQMFTDAGIEIDPDSIAKKN